MQLLRRNCLKISEAKIKAGILIDNNLRIQSMSIHQEHEMPLNVT